VIWSARLLFVDNFVDSQAARGPAICKIKGLAHPHEFGAYPELLANQALAFAIVFGAGWLAARQFGSAATRLLCISQATGKDFAAGRP
jgi:hypothetical protein